MIFTNKLFHERVVQTMSDELHKVDLSINRVLAKITRQYLEQGGTEEELKINGMTKHTYVTNFEWDEARYVYRKPLPETVERIQSVSRRHR